MQQQDLLEDMQSGNMVGGDAVRLPRAQSQSSDYSPVGAFLTRPARSFRGKHRKKKNMRRFSHDEIEKKVKERAHVPGYRDMLMQAAVTHDKDGGVLFRALNLTVSGVVFDTSSQAWRRLVQFVKKTPLSVTSPGSHSQPGSARGRETMRLQRPRAAIVRDPQLMKQLQMELKESKPDPFVVRHACKIVGIPDELRGQVWQVLLGVHSYEPEPSFDNVEFDLPNQRVVRGDIERTLGDVPIFRDLTVRHDMEVLLTRYCKEENVSYKQGMNYVLAPFFCVGLTSREDIYRCFSALLARLLPNTFRDEEFGSLQCMFALFRLLLLYHDPKLCTQLDSHDMGPELYASGWFLTLHANRTRMSVVLFLWDLLLLEANDDPQLHIFVSLALLIAHRDRLLSEDPVALPQTLSSLSIQSPLEVAHILHKARLVYRAQTPLSFRQHLRRFSNNDYSPDAPELANLVRLPCLCVSASELIAHAYRNTHATSPKSESSLKYFLVDVRSKEHYEVGHLPCAYHLLPTRVLVAEQLAEEVRQLAAMKGCHFVVLCDSGSGIDAAATPIKERRTSTAIRGSAIADMLVLSLLQRGFKFVSVVEGGFQACHELLVSGQQDFELVDHDPERCSACVPPPELKRGFFRRLFAKARSSSPEPLQDSKSDPNLISKPTQEMPSVGEEKEKEKEKENVKEEEKEEAKEPDVVLPKTVVRLPSSPSLLLLQASLWTAKVRGQQLLCTLQALTNLVVNAVIAHFGVKERTSTDAARLQAETLRPIVGVSVCEADDLLLRASLQPFAPTANARVGKVVINSALSGGQATQTSQPRDLIEFPHELVDAAFPPSPNDPFVVSRVHRRSSSHLMLPASSSSEEKTSPQSLSLPISPREEKEEEAAKGLNTTKLFIRLARNEPVKADTRLLCVLPHDVAGRALVLFVSVLSIVNADDVILVLRELARHRGSQLTLASLVASPTALQRVAEAFPDLPILLAVVDLTPEEKDEAGGVTPLASVLWERVRTPGGFLCTAADTLYSLDIEAVRARAALTARATETTAETDVDAPSHRKTPHHPRRTLG